ncbi:MAG: 2-amino-4-hydroxy-6-hydroxymethyldihydropteridine diphosphokinase [Chthoniobacterales bacterium]
MSVGIALGSNLGESEKILTLSIEELKKIHQGTDDTFRVSSFYKTAPVDCPPESPFFLNAVLELETKLLPHALLYFLRTLEKKSGRSFPYAYHAPRTLDLDLLYYDSITIFTPELELPHPRIRERSFVLKPLVEINPHLILPGWELSTQAYLKILEKNNSHE